MSIHISGPWFKDDAGRTRLLKGVNLGGSTKLPTVPDGATYRPEGLHDHRNVSFVGRPFPLEEADEHLSRLKSWGLTFLRFLITWEAIEHAGPGQYDEAYLDYLAAVLEKAGEYGFTLFIDPHQDVWSRFTGGDGAPGWTLEAAGFDIENLHATGAAVVHALYDGPYPRMVWPTNNAKLAAATMWTLFFAGNDLAPQTTIEGEPAQAYLQRHYINAILQVVERVKGMDHVIGYDTLNEPSVGYIGWHDLHQPGGAVQMDLMPTALQSMALGEGIPQMVSQWRMSLAGMSHEGEVLFDPSGKRAWQEDKPSIWRENGVWDLDAAGNPVLLKPDHFHIVDGREINFAQDYYKPFAVRFAEAIHGIDPAALIFLETEFNDRPPHWSAEDPPNIVYAPHWYDAGVLFLHRYLPFMAVDSRTSTPVFGLPSRIDASFQDQIGQHQRDSAEYLGDAPVVLGEFGIAYNMGEKKAFRTGDFSMHVKALDRSIRALEARLMNYTLWNYTADNDNAHGDQWNDEDLSIFSRDQQADPDDINSGGRAIEAFLRPHPVAVPGEPTSWQYDYKKRRFTFSFRHDPEISAPAEFYIPAAIYRDGVRVSVSDGTAEVDMAVQQVRYQPGAGAGVKTITITSA